MRLPKTTILMSHLAMKIRIFSIIKKSLVRIINTIKETHLILTIMNKLKILLNKF